MLKTAEFLVSRRGEVPAGRRVQAANEPVQLPGDGRRRAEDPRRSAARRPGSAIVTELMDTEFAERGRGGADIIQIGTRNMQNFSLLKRVGKCRKPVLLKRGMSATLEEWLMAAEYVMAGGNYQVILCERGVRTFSDHSRNTLDLSVIPPAKALCHLPIFVDPSHGTGKRAYVPAMSLAALAAGADGLLVEAHPEPDKAMSDGASRSTSRASSAAHAPEGARPRLRPDGVSTSQRRRSSVEISPREWHVRRRPRAARQ